MTGEEPGAIARSRRLWRHGVVLGLALNGAPIPAAAQDEGPLLCALTQVLECIEGGLCQQADPDAVGAPRFVHIDAANGRVHNPEAGEQAPGSTVEHSERVDGKLILQGIDPGVEELRDGIGWTAAISAGGRSLVVTAAGDGVAYVAFGACMPAPG